MRIVVRPLEMLFGWWNPQHSQEPTTKYSRDRSARNMARCYNTSDHYWRNKRSRDEYLIRPSWRLERTLHCGSLSKCRTNLEGEVVQNYYLVWFPLLYAQSQDFFQIWQAAAKHQQSWKITLGEQTDHEVAGIMSWASAEACTGDIRLQLTTDGSYSGNSPY